MGKDLNDLLAIDPTTNIVREVVAYNKPPPRRKANGGCMGSCWVLFAGYDDSFFDDFFYIDLSSETKRKHSTEVLDKEGKVMVGCETSTIYVNSFALEQCLSDITKEICL